MKQDVLFRQVYIDLMMMGKESSPRGMLTRELENFHVVFGPEHQFINFGARKLNLDYIKTEIRWYLKGDKADLSICDHAKIWQGCVHDGVIQSNYGHYLFKEKGLLKVVQELTQDPDSRRAIVNIFNQRDHLTKSAKDVPCTSSLSFRIRNGKVNMTVHMRSQDAVYGLGNDLPFFNLCWEIVAKSLNLPMGTYHHFVESFHVYERHYDMLTKIIEGDGFKSVSRPELTTAEAIKMVAHLPVEPDSTDFSRWLYAA